MSSQAHFNTMTILLLGSGGREHALAWSLSRSPSVARLICAPGNPGMGAVAELRQIDAEDPAAVALLAVELGADLVVVGPEAPLAEGVADAVLAAGIPVFGPSQAASRLEWDKGFAKDFMGRHAIPTSASRTFTNDRLDEARAYLSTHPLPVVIKASGLAAGKGVVIAGTNAEAVATAEWMLGGEAFGDAGSSIVVEEFMQGEEASIFAVTDGEHYRILPSSQDHKRVGDGDTGPNTGGMGAYAPAPIVTEAIIEQVRNEVIEPTLRGMLAEGNRYVGCLYVGLMIEGDRARVVEFNSRFGDPETQVVLPLVKEDLAKLFYDAASGALETTPYESPEGCAVAVVMASEGYPGSYAKGKEIIGIDAAEQEDGIVVFQAGTKLVDGTLQTNGGRVLAVTAVLEKENDLEKGIARAYHAVQSIRFDGAFYRNDIGRKGIAVAE